VTHGEVEEADTRRVVSELRRVETGAQSRRAPRRDRSRIPVQIPDREERKTLKVGVAVDLYVYGPKRDDKQDTVKVRITKWSGRRPNVRYTATVETLLKQTNLPRGTKEVEFGPENVASVYIPRETR
jgi:hypothetical protein